MTAYLCAVDVGTASARAGILDASGRLLGRHSYPIDLRWSSPLVAQHSSENIWSAVCRAVSGALLEAGVDADRIAGLAFDATCSLVVRDREEAPLCVSSCGDPAFDTIAWLDHRAAAEAAECTATGDPFLANLGGSMSPEMQTPKLMWLKRRHPEQWDRAGHLFDLCDFLSWRATGSTSRSLCSLATKWAYQAQQPSGWQTAFLDRVGLADMTRRGGLPDHGVAPGTRVGSVAASTARELGLRPGTAVAAGMVDAFAGALGVLGPVQLAGSKSDVALVGGTSSCIMSYAATPQFVQGFWGPYLGPTLPGLWMTEGGQSATGALLDHVVRLHACGGEPTQELHRRIATRVVDLRAAEGMAFARDLHVLPDFHGNRTPLADPSARGVVSGLSLDASFDGLCRLYWRCCVAIALGVRQIIEAREPVAGRPHRLLLAGGHVRNPLLAELYADVTGLPLAWHEQDSMLLGTAMAAAVAAGLHGTLESACLAMAQPLQTRPADRAAGKAYDRDYRIFLEMDRHRRSLETMD